MPGLDQDTQDTVNAIADWIHRTATAMQEADMASDDPNPADLGRVPTPPRERSGGKVMSMDQAFPDLHRLGSGSQIASGATITSKAPALRLPSGFEENFPDFARVRRV